VAALLPIEPARAARASIAFMEIGAVVCTARSPRCTDCPFFTLCAWRVSGAPPLAGPSRKRQAYTGTDRHVRGLLMSVLRDATGPVPRQRLDLVWADDAQRARALAGLVADGLAEPLGADHFTLPGAH
jgi:A/G-specific adenine glycosylase